jgi:hypothetical protein
MFGGLSARMALFVFENFSCSECCKFGYEFNSKLRTLKGGFEGATEVDSELAWI